MQQDSDQQRRLDELERRLEEIWKKLLKKRGS